MKKGRAKASVRAVDQTHIRWRTILYLGCFQGERFVLVHAARKRYALRHGLTCPCVPCARIPASQQSAANYKTHCSL